MKAVEYFAYVDATERPAFCARFRDEPSKARYAHEFNEALGALAQAYPEDFGIRLVRIPRQEAPIVG